MNSILNHYPSDPRGQATFAFDHANEHSILSMQMASPSTYNLQRYLLDPAMPGAAGAGQWDMVHQQAHDDAAAWYSVQPSLPLVDTQQSEGSQQQWLFVNSQEHIALSGAALAASG